MHDDDLDPLFVENCTCPEPLEARRCDAPLGYTLEKTPRECRLYLRAAQDAMAKELQAS